MGVFPDAAQNGLPAQNPPPAQNGLVALKSAFPVKETLDRLAHLVESKGLAVFCRIDHAANAVSAGLELRPTEVLIFGNAKGGTPLMQAAQTIGIDLPLKALAWQDASGQTWLGYNDPSWLTSRHGIEALGAGPATAMRTMLSAVTRDAAIP
jgi:uncharacterized protein (DUF302 family)